MKKLLNHKNYDAALHCIIIEKGEISKIMTNHMYHVLGFVGFFLWRALGSPSLFGASPTSFLRFSIYFSGCFSHNHVILSIYLSYKMWI